MALAFAVFALWPRLDLAAAGLFFDPTTGFATFDTGPANFVRLAIWRASEILLALAIAATALGFWTRAPVLTIPRRVWGYIVLLYLIAPGLLVDVVVKRFWGRARPEDVTEFGGPLIFTPPHQISGQCLRNCSFVAGEMAGAVTLAVALWLILASARHRLSPAFYRGATLFIPLLPLYAGFQRIAAGRHFLSDVIMATLLVLLVAEILRRMLLRPGST